jgi:hypothetical protein
MGFVTDATPDISCNFRDKAGQLDNQLQPLVLPQPSQT